MARPISESQAENKFVEEVLDKLFSAEYRRLGGLISELVTTNNIKKKCNAHGYTFMGEYRTPVTEKGIAQKFETLDFTLSDRGNAIELEHSRTSNDRQMIRQLLTQLFRGQKDRQMLRDRIPDSLVRFTAYESIPRAAPLEEHIKDNTRLLNLYQQLIPKINTLAVSAMLY